MKIPRPRVVAEPGPRPADLVQLGRGEARHIRPTLEESAVIGRDRRNGGLLKHDLVEPDAIGIGRFARLGAPGKVAPMRVVPGEQEARSARLLCLVSLMMRRL